MGWILIPALALVLMWAPVAAHYYVPSPHLTLETIITAKGAPSDALASQVAGDRLLTYGSNSEEVTLMAEDLLKGDLRFGGRRAVRMGVPFRPAFLTVGDSSTQLYVAGLVPADLLLRAYEFTGEDRFLDAAGAYIVDFAKYEQRTWWPRGLLWNDHAIANRIFVLSDFWRVYRHRPDFRTDVASVVLGSVARNGVLLSRPQHFTFATNHGVMQNVALLRFALSFPTLPERARYQRLAVQRLREQMPFYVSGEGVILEHSPSYQFFGVNLLQRAFDYMRLLGLVVPEEWEAMLSRGRDVSAALRRPDGSLPAIGDTPWRTRVRPIGPSQPTTDVSWWPVGGLGIWWDGLGGWPSAKHLRQTVVTFAYFPGHAHKHADDLSVVLWAAGRSWWSNVGFWPYDSPQRAAATSWAGSNAPHLVGESTRSDRNTSARSFGSTGRLVAIDVERRGPGSYVVRRQVIHLRPDVWFVLDSVGGQADRETITRWSASPGVRMYQDVAGARYRLASAADGSGGITAFFTGSAGVNARVISAHPGPFGTEGERGVPAVEVTHPPGARWAATLWVLDAEGTKEMRPDARARMTSWQSAEHWTVVLHDTRDRLEISRRGQWIRATEDSTGYAMRLEPSDVSGAVEAIRNAFQGAAGSYPQFSPRLRLRRLATLAFVVVIPIQEAVILAASRRRKKLSATLRILTSVMWLIGGLSAGVVMSRI